MPNATHKCSMTQFKSSSLRWYPVLSTNWRMCLLLVVVVLEMFPPVLLGIPGACAFCTTDMPTLIMRIGRSRSKCWILMVFKLHRAKRFLCVCIMTTIYRILS